MRSKMRANDAQRPARTTALRAVRVSLVGRVTPCAPLTNSRACPRSQSPQPNAENDGNYQSDPAYAHWDRQRSDVDLDLVDQPEKMPNCKNAEKNAGNAQSNFR